MRVPWDDSHLFTPAWYDRKRCKCCWSARGEHPGAEPIGALEQWRDLWFGGWENKFYLAISLYFGIHLWFYHSGMTKGDCAFCGYWLGTSLTCWGSSK